MENGKESISPAEWTVMRVVWTLGETDAKTVGSSVDPKLNWAEATVKTLLNRLVKKGYLQTRKEGRRFIYSATVAEQSTMASELSKLLGAMCAHKLGGSLVKVLDETTLSKSDIDQLTTMLQSKRQDAPDAVECNCVNHDTCGHHAVS